MKRKRLAIIASVGILLGGYITAPPIAVAADSQVNEGKQAENGVLTLKIEDAVERALKNDRNIIILAYQYELLKLEKELNEDLKDDFESKVDDVSTPGFISLIESLLPYNGVNTYEDFLQLADEELKQEILQLALAKFQENQAIAEKKKKELTSEIEKLESGLKQNEVSDEKLRLQLEETKEGIRFMIKGRYMELLTLKESLTLQKNVLDSLKADIYKAEHEVYNGTASRRSVTLLKRELTKQENELTKNKRNYELQFKNFLLDVGISATENVQLIEPDYTSLPKIDKSKAKETEKTYLDKSFALKKIEQDIEKLDYDLDKLYDDEHDYTHYYDDMIQQNIKINLEKKKQIEQNLKKHVASLYEKAEEAYESIQEKKWSLENQKEDEQQLAIQYELGLISKHEYEKANLANKQAHFDEYITKVTYYLALEEIAVVEKGILLSQ